MDNRKSDYFKHLIYKLVSFNSAWPVMASIVNFNYKNWIDRGLVAKNKINMFRLYFIVDCHYHNYYNKRYSYRNPLPGYASFSLLILEKIFFLVLYRTYKKFQIIYVEP